MIRTAFGSEVTGFLKRISERPELYAEVFLCSPFIDASLLPAITLLLVRARRAGCGTRVITTPVSAVPLERYLLPASPRDKGTLVIRARLHAKIYLARALRHDQSEVIITSANLTQGGTATNLELGVHCLGTTAAGRELFSQAHHFVRRLAA